MAEYEDCFVFLLGKAYQRAHGLLKKKLLPFGLTPVQHLTLEVLRGEETISPAEISERTVMDSATLSGVLDRMADAGLIKKEENPEDRRSIRVSITAKARKMMDGLAEQRKAVNEELTSVLSIEEKLLLKRMLKEIKG
jgi:DNA-binding MarR family transcriptional regulator